MPFNGPPLNCMTISSQMWEKIWALSYYSEFCTSGLSSLQNTMYLRERTLSMQEWGWRVLQILKKEENIDLNFS